MSEEGKGMFDNIITSLVNGYEKVIKIFKKHGILYAIFIMVIFILFWSFIVNPIKFNNIIEERLKAHTEQIKQEEINNVEELIERRYEANEIIGDIMSKLLYKFQANRVLLLEKHNSVKSLGNVDFLYLSASLEMIDLNNPDTDYISEDLQRQMTVNLLGNDVLGLLKHSKYLWFDNLQEYDKSQCRLLNKLKKENEKQVIIYPFCDSKHRPLLILVVCGEQLNKSDIVSYIDEFGKQITDLLIFQ